MGRARTITTPVDPSASRVVPALARAADATVGTVLLVLSLPLMAVLAVAVLRSSHGPVLHRERAVGRHGRPVELLSFRSALDGSGTVAHARLRATVGGSAGEPLTGVGRLMRRSRTDRLPRLFNVVAGHTRLF